MKIDKISLKWKLFFYILIFAIAIVLLFSIFQVVLLDDFYRVIKTRDINDLTEKTAGVILNNSENKVVMYDNLETTLNKYEKDNEANIYVFKKNANSFNSVYGTGESSGEFGVTIAGKIEKIWDVSKVVDKRIFYIYLYESTDEIDVEVTEYTKPLDKAKEKDTLISGMFLNDTHILIVESRLTPVEPAVMAMKYQIMIISIIVLLLTIVIALILSKVISKPIIAINDTAKEMAEGNLSVKFTGKGYSEITELNNTLNHTVEELKKTETLQRELIANVSHDLRTPLTLVSGYAEMMKDFPEENNEENIQVIIDETKRLSLLVNDLLNLSRMQSRTEELNLEIFDIKHLVEDIIERQNRFYENSDVHISFTCNCENAVVKADTKKIEQVIYNFITNAINYSDKNKNIDVFIIRENDNVIIKVTDHGIGIKKEHLEYIWQRYYRIDKSLQRSTQGSGLGLSIIKEILDYHGFKYGVISEENVGSTFYFEMPIENNL